MADNPMKRDDSLSIANGWCKKRGAGWSVSAKLGVGGTAPVFEVASPGGLLALKIYDSKFSDGSKGVIEEKRIDQQLALKGHDCPFLVHVFEGGRFENRLFLLMSRAPGTELEKCLNEVPRNKIRQIVSQIAQAAIFLRDKGLCHRDIKAANIFISEDFECCTLLDVSVVRNVSDAIGVGTDHDGQLPIVATARYSPPEYLFRLLEPGPELWHALNVYQMGSLLHDLIMREPLFEAEYLRSAENRYRFAWTIATSHPKLMADDVDRDLLFTARRALDKDWQRRSHLRLEDFLIHPSVQLAHALQVLGLGIAKESTQEVDTPWMNHNRMRAVAVDLEGRVMQYLRDKGVHAVHEILPGPDDMAKLILFRWKAPALEAESEPPHIHLELDLKLKLDLQGNNFALSVKLRIQILGEEKLVLMNLPTVQDETGVEALLFDHSVDAFNSLAQKINRVDTAGSEP